MSFDEVQLDPLISYGTTGGPSYKTTVVTTDSGGEQRIQQWLNGRMKWNLSTGTKSQSQMAAISTFMRARQGKARGFRFKDWTDYKATREHFWNGFTTGTVRLVKTYGDTGNTEIRKIKKPIDSVAYASLYPDRRAVSPLQIFTAPTGGSPLTVGTDYTIDYTTGIITGLAGSTDYYWTGEFDVPVRFDTDETNINLSDFNIRTWDGIPIIELILPD